MSEIVWKSGRSRSVDAVAAHKEIRELIDEGHGHDLPQALVNKSKPEGALLHDFFEHDTKRAANEHRKHQARQIISSIVVRTDGGKENRAFLSVGAKYVTSQVGPRKSREVTAVASPPSARRSRCVSEPVECGPSRTYYASDSVQEDDTLRSAFVSELFDKFVTVCHQTLDYAEFAGVRDAVAELGTRLVQEGFVPPDVAKKCADIFKRK